MSAARARRPQGYADGHAHLAGELGVLDLRLRLRAAALRRAWAGRPETDGNPMHVADDEVDRILSRPPPLAAGDEEAALRRALAEAEDEVQARVAAGVEGGAFLPLVQLAGLFGLSRWEAQALVVCLAPELRRGYDRIYAWLQDDITRKRPSVDLTLELLCDGEAQRWSARAVLAPGARLLDTGLLQAVDDPHSPSGSSGLARILRVDPRIVHYLLGHDGLDPRLAGLAELHAADASDPAVEDEARDALLAFAGRWAAAEGARPRVVLHLHGPAGVGKREMARALAGRLGAPALEVDGARLAARGDEAEALLRLAFRESLLQQAPLYLSGADALLAEGEGAGALRAALGRAAGELGWLLVLGAREPWRGGELFDRALFHSAALPRPGVPVRERAWARTLEQVLPGAPAAELAPLLADRFRLTPGKIREAALEVAAHRSVHAAEHEVALHELAAACRAQGRHGLGALATRVDVRHGWEHLVLPDEALLQLREMCDQVRHRHLVYDRWGFGRTLARGISALFSGPPGTGKTMAAEVIAGELGLDLYKIDLARVVSKWIGETEKNLGKIFDEAEESDAILFFDEADALFGKRTEVTDSRDRYANLETSYLLQRMEEYGGVVILASNLRDNMDDAFVRRLRFLVDFPFPEAPSRLRIWQTHVPAQAPLGDDVDWQLLAERVPVAGGNIKNIVLAAAFFAAANGGVLGMDHLLRGTRREYEKIGKLFDGAMLTRPGGRR
ncbi:MAG TPA: AAA family ATPase [Longimicrobium sp.]|nr:AAA family ATPase [Longimicrobium sp.]